MRYYFLALGTILLVCVGCAVDGQQLIDKGEYHAPPAQMLAQPGPMVDLARPGVMPPLTPPGMGMHQAFASKTSQLRFLGPAGMNIGWQIGQGYAENQLVAPGRYNFRQAQTYRLKLTNIRGREMTLYPTLEVYPSHPTTDAYLTHNSVPIQLNDEDLDQIEANNFVTKVIYLPEPKFQELAIAGVKELVSTRLDPGVDPVAEADKRGTIMAVLRIGNMDLEMPGGLQGPAITQLGPDGQVIQTSHNVVDGFQGQHVEPMPIGPAGVGSAIPSPQMMGVPGYPGQPPYNPIAGVNGAPKWGMPITATPIGLPGPTHLPFGGPAGMKSHTIRNHTEVDLGKPVDHVLVDVKHDPGIRMPHPVKHVEITEKHPVYSAGEVNYPGGPGGGFGGGCPTCPPGGPFSH